MAFNKVKVVGEVSVEDFGSKARFLVRGEVFILFAKGNILFVFAEYLSRHFESAYEFRAVGEEVSPL
jgi:hypothetical protein